MLETKIEDAKAALAAAVSGLENQAFYREALLLRLCFDGYRLNEAVRLRKDHFFLDVPDPLRDQKQFFHPAAFHLRMGFPETIGVLHPIELLMRIARPDDDARADADHWLKSALFPSRKGKVPLTPRSSERLLSSALGVGFGPTAPKTTFRKAFELGKLFRRNRSSDSRITDPNLDIERVLRRIQWMVRQLFRNESDRSDAEQQIRLELFRLTGSHHWDGDLHDLAITVTRSTHAAMIGARKRKPEVLFEDLARLSDKESVNDVVDVREQRELHEFIHEEIGRLTAREATVIRSLFEEGKTCSEVASRLGCSDTTITQIRRCALEKLRVRLRADGRAIERLGI